MGKPRHPGVDDWGFPIRGYVAPPKKHRVPKKGPGSVGHDAVLAGLRALGSIQAPGETFTRDQIAAACFCTEHNIREIEKRALRKMREILGPAFKAALRERLNAAA